MLQIGHSEPNDPGEPRPFRNQIRRAKLQERINSGAVPLTDSAAAARVTAAVTEVEHAIRSFQRKKFRDPSSKRCQIEKYYVVQRTKRTFCCVSSFCDFFWEKKNRTHVVLQQCLS